MMKTIGKRPMWTVAQREMLKLRNDWAHLFLTFFGPLLAFLLVAAIFSSNVPTSLPVAVVDHDRSHLSRQLIRMIDATPIAVADTRFQSLEEARLALEAGETDAVIYISSGFEKNILKGSKGSIALYLNNTNVVKAGLLNSGIRKATGTLNAGIKLQVQLKNGQTQSQALNRVLPVQLHSVLLFNPYISYSYFLTAALMPLLLVLFVLLSSIYSIGDELYRGTGLAWLRSANRNFPVALAGKLLPYTLIYFCLALIMNITLFGFLDMPLKGHLDIILMADLLLIVSYQFMAIFLIGITGNMRLSLSLGSAYCMLALTYSGLTFPGFGMPALGQSMAAIFPYSWWLKVLMGQSLRGEPASNGIISMMTLWVFVALGLMLIPRLKFLILHRKSWGKK